MVAPNGYEPGCDEGDSDMDEYFDDGYDGEEYGISMCAWEACLNETVYDDALLKIVCMAEDKNEKAVHMCSKWTSMLFLLVVNLMLQGIVVSRVYKIVGMERLNSAKIFGPPLGIAGSGSCYQRDSSTFPEFVPNVVGAVTKKPIENPAEVWDCGPMPVMLMSNVSWLNTNGDTYWSIDEAIKQTDYSKTILPLGKASGNFTRIFQELVGDVQEFIAVKGKLGDAEVTAETAEYTRIPMKWLIEEQDMLKMCNNVDPHLCGNLESRGILQTLKLRNNPHDTSSRIKECRKAFDWCGQIYGELFRRYFLMASEMCGDMESLWFKASPEDSGFNLNKYSKSSQFSPEEADSVTRFTYLAFLALVLIIWWLAVTEELRAILSWWVVMVTIPSGDTIVESSEGMTTIKAVNKLSKALVIVLVLLPRTCIAVALAIIGTDFLVVADDYTDLILNSVALAFISEVDEMLFAAVMSKHQKEILAQAEPLKGEHTFFGCCEFLNHHTIHTTIPLLVGVLAVVGFRVHMVVTHPGGVFGLSLAYDCLCQAAGPTCMAAQIFGGLPRVPPSA